MGKQLRYAEKFENKMGNVTRIASLGMAPCSNQVAMMVVQIIMNQSLKHYGSHSIYGENIPIACAGIITKVNMIFYVLCHWTFAGVTADCKF